MKMKYFGIDIGNHSTKSKNTVITSGFEGPYNAKPTIADKYLLFQDKYYIPSTTILAYQKDKTTNERAIVLALMSIAEEIIYTCSKVKKNSPPLSKSEVQAKIDKYNKIALGIGLPPTHYTESQVKKNIDYFNLYMGNGISFVYADYKFNLKLEVCRVYPQAGAGAINATRIASFPSYFVIDIGGYTVDTIFFEDGKPSGHWSSKEKGVLTLYKSIIDTCTMEFEITLDSRIIETVLKGGQTILEDDVKETIFQRTKQHAEDIINTLKESGIEFKAYPCFFMGGGSLLLKKYIETNPIISKNGLFFIEDTKANAAGYTIFIKDEIQATL